jgi:CRISPR-associated protein (TIGR03986 family)
MNGTLSRKRGVFELAWTDGKFKSRKLDDRDSPAVAAALGFEIEQLSDDLDRIQVDFEQQGGILTALTLSPESLQTWVQAGKGDGTGPDVSSDSTARLAALVDDELQDGSMLSGRALSETQKSEVLERIIATKGPLPPDSDLIAYNRWKDGFPILLADTITEVAGPVPPPFVPITESRGFRNPFHYVPTPPRTSADKVLADAGSLVDLAQQAGHHRAQPGRFSGDFTIRFAVKTPLLVLDHERPVESIAEDQEHFGWTTTCHAGFPFIQPTSARGLLRSLVRAATNSRFRTLPDKLGDTRTGYRLGTDAARRLMPVRLRGSDATGWHAEILYGDNPSRLGNGVQHAAWLHLNTQLPGGLSPTSGQVLQAELKLYRHTVRNFEYWRVVRIATPGSTYGPEPMFARGTHRAADPTRTKTVIGVAHITRKTATNKHDDRLFFVEGQPPTSGTLPKEPIGQAAKNDFQLLLHQYFDLERSGTPAYPVAPPYIAARTTVVDGMLCYALFDAAGAIESLHPALLPRALHNSTIADTIDTSLRPASHSAELSPVDRLFGWANDSGSGSLRSRVSVIGLDATNLEVTESVAGWIPLEVQSSPKNSPRFSGSPNSGGGPHKPEERQDIRWGHKANTIRGHKVWISPTGSQVDPRWWKLERDEQAVYQRGLQPENRPVQDNQNKSVDSWIGGGYLDVRVGVKNLSAFELGALLWLFDPSPGREVKYRLGMGKSLGFGAVAPTLTNWNVATTEELRAYWDSLETTEPTPAPESIRKELKDNFAKLMNAAYPAVLRDLDQLRRGYEDGLPLAPPRERARRDPRDKLWFFRNESTSAEKGGRQDLGPVVGNDGLTFFNG